MSSSHRPPPGPPPDQLNVFDPNSDHPDEPPPSYDEAFRDPTIDQNQHQSQTHNQPQPPPQHQRPLGPPPVRQSPVIDEKQQYREQSRQQPPPPNQQGQQGSSTIQLPKPTPINPNPYLPWRYPSTFRCSKCENTGFRTKNGKPCKKCWPQFRRGVVPPASQAELERLVKHKPPPKPLNQNVQKLPPGTYPMMAQPYGRPVNMPTVVQPGDPRIGGILCQRCSGRGMVHFFLDLERCSVCNGLGRVNFNGRPL